MHKRIMNYNPRKKKSRVFVGKPEGRHGHRLEGNNKIDLNTSPSGGSFNSKNRGSGKVVCM
jgi:hypothetical protein